MSTVSSTLAVVGLIFETVDCALEKTRGVFKKLQGDLVSPLVRLACILKVQTAGVLTLEEVDRVAALPCHVLIPPSQILRLPRIYIGKKYHSLVQR